MNPELEAKLPMLQICLEFVRGQIEAGVIVPIPRPVMFPEPGYVPGVEKERKNRYYSISDIQFMDLIQLEITRIEKPKPRIEGGQDEEKVKFITFNMFYSYELAKFYPGFIPSDSDIFRIWGVATFPAWIIPDGHWYFLTDAKRIYDLPVVLPAVYNNEVPVSFEVIPDVEDKNKEKV